MSGGNTFLQSSEIPPYELRVALSFGALDRAAQDQIWQDELQAQRAIEARNYDEAARLLESLAASGSQWAVDRQISLDEHRAWRMTCARDYKRARPLLESLAARGSPWAMNQLGRLHRDGKFGMRDLDSAIAQFDKAAGLGHAPAYKCLGCAHMRKGDLESARIAFIKGAEQGQKRSMVMAGLMLVFEPRNETDTETGIAWLNHAAYGANAKAANVELARTGLGRMRLWSRAIWLALVAATRARFDPNYDKAPTV